MKVPAYDGGATKWCARCLTEKLVASFPHQPKMRGGIGSWCRACQNAKNRDWRQRNAEHRRAWARARYQRQHQPKTGPCIDCGTEVGGLCNQWGRRCDKCRARATTCIVEGCDRPRKLRADGRQHGRLCDMHKQRKSDGLFDCETLGCTKLARIKGYCREHAPVIIPWSSCPRCGEQYIKRGGRVHCKRPSASRPRDPEIARMYYKRWADKHGVGNRPERTAECPACGASFTTRIASQRYCSAECGKRASHRMAKDRREARQRDAFVEPVYRRKVFERDGWRCQICHRLVKRDAVVPHPKAPVIDHILPLAEGGKHCYANVQTAHFMCNSIKSAGIANGAEQLRLVG